MVLNLYHRNISYICIYERIFHHLFDCADGSVNNYINTLTMWGTSTNYRRYRILNTRKFIKKLHKDLSFESVRFYYEKKGWHVIFFTENEQLISRLGLSDRITEKGFIYSNEFKKYIFINANLSAKEKRNAIFHEAGHIELNHDFSDLCNEAKEREAQEFANELIKYASENKKSLGKHNKIVSAVALVAIAILFYFIGSKTSTWQKNNSNTVNTVAPAEDTSDTQLQYVYVTPSGKKYHTKNCYYIRNNKTLQKIDLKTAKQNYLPCSNCIN